MKERTFSAGDTVTSEGSSGVGFFVIESGEATVVHGDYRLDNLVIAQDEPKVRAVLDWELSTLVANSDLKCYGLTSWEFRPLVETHGSIAWKLLQAMSKTYQG